MGERTRAKSSYEEFLTLWKDADPEIPILKEAKTEYTSGRRLSNAAESPPLRFSSSCVISPGSGVTMHPKCRWNQMY